MFAICWSPVSYFSVAEVKHMAKALAEGMAYFLLGFRREKSLVWWRSRGTAAGAGCGGLIFSVPQIAPALCKLQPKHTCLPAS